MRSSVLAGTAAVALCSVPATASTIVQDVSGTNRAGTSLVLFDPSLGTLNSVEIDGSMSWSVDLVRNALDGAPAVDIARSASGSLLLSSGPTVATTTLTGSEAYPAGSMFGSIALSGALFAILTGTDMNPFLVSGSRTTDLFAPFASVAPQVGSIVFNPASPGGTYSVRVTYDFTPVPEPSAWAMMLVGFAAIGLLLRYRSRTGSRLMARHGSGGRLANPA